MKLTAKRRRSKLQIAEDKRREEEEKQSTRLKLQELETLKAQMQDMQNRMGQAADLHEQVQSLVDDGILKQGADGNLIEVEDPNERQSIQIQTGSKKRVPVEQIDTNRRQAQFFGASQFKDDPSSMVDDDKLE